LLGCIALMEANLEQPLLHHELAPAVGLSKRQMERLFSRYLDTTPSRYYMDLRLKMGRRLLEQTSLPILEVALACGFSSPGHFSHRYRALFGVSPRQERSTG
ncbi:MAG: helix-turn-helix domain-containing protein, partial [Acidiferrobacterales bacterium]